MMLVVVMGLFPMSILFPTLKTGPKVLGIVFKCSKFSVIIHNLSPQILCVFVVVETGAREAIGGDFDFIAKTYGYNADIEELIATRNW